MQLKRSLPYRIINRLSDIAGIVSACCLLSVSLIVVYEVFMRYAFNSPTTWVGEMSVYLIMATGMLAASYTLRNNSHFTITILTDRLSSANQRRLRVVTDIAGALYCSVFVFKGMELVRFSYEMEDVSSGLLEAPLWVPNLLIPVGGVLLTLQFLNRIVDNITGQTQA